MEQWNSIGRPGTGWQAAALTHALCWNAPEHYLEDATKAREKLERYSVPAAVLDVGLGQLARVVRLNPEVRRLYTEEAGQDWTGQDRTGRCEQSAAKS